MDSRGRNGIYWQRSSDRDLMAGITQRRSKSVFASNEHPSTPQWVLIGLTGAVLGMCVVGTARYQLSLSLPILLMVLVPFALVIVGNVKRSLLFVILMEIPLQLDIYLNFREEAEQLNALVGFNISVSTLCLMGLYALWGAELLARARTLENFPRYAVLSALAYLVAAAASVFVARDVELALFEVFLLLQTFLLFIYILHAVRTRQDVVFVVTVLFMGLILQSLIMIGLRVSGQSIRFASIFARIDDSMRVGGTVGSPNTAASYLSLLLAPALSFLFMPEKLWRRRLASAAFGLGVVAILLTFSRGGWVAFTVSMSVLVFCTWRRGLLSARNVFLIAVFGVAILVFAQDEILQRLLGNDQRAAYSRIPLMRISWRIIQDHMLLGVGANNFTVALSQYLTPEFNQEWISNAHTKYLLVWAEGGVVTFAAFIWFLGVAICRSWQVWMADDALLSPLALGFLGALLGQTLHMAVDIFNSRPQVQMLWLIAALIVAMHGIVRQEKGYPSATHVPINQ